MKHLKFFALLLTAVMFASCGKSVKSDPKTEDELYGGWLGEYTEEEWDDGDFYKYRNEVGYIFDVTTHEFTVGNTLSMVSPIKMSFGSVYGGGTWKASAEKIELEFDAAKTEIELSKSIRNISSLDEIKDMEEELRDAFSGKQYLTIISLSNGKLTVKDDENTEYTLTLQ